MTAEFKGKVIAELQEALNKMEAELGFIEQRAKKTITELTIKASPQAQAVREQLEWEKNKREEAIAEINERMRFISGLQEGTEVPQNELEGPIEVKVGDSWDEIFSKEIVLKDGVIVEIR